MSISAIDPAQNFQLNLANYFAVSSRPNNAWGPRTIQDFEFIYMVKGRSRYFESRGRSLAIEEGQTLLIPPQLEHTFACDVDALTIISCIHFNFERDPELQAPLVLPGNNDYEIHHLFRKCAAEFQGKRNHFRELLNMNLREIWIRLKRAGQAELKKSEPPKLMRARLFIEDNHDKPITRGHIAKHLKITPEHVNYLFRKYYNMPPMVYLLHLRIEKAQQLLLSQALNVSQVAFKVGFSDPLYFSRAFKKIVGLSPSIYASRI